MSLRTQILRGGVYLALRQGLGTLLSLAGVVLLTRQIGPAAYGTYAGALGLYAYLLLVSQAGINVHLIRRPTEPTETDYHRAFSCMMTLAALVVGLGLLLLPALQAWLNLPELAVIAGALFLGLPAQLAALVPLARLERQLDYRRVAVVELAGQVTFYALALPLAWRGWGAWAPVIGWWGQTLLSLIALHRLTGYRPRWSYDRGAWREMLGYGLALSAGNWFWQLRNLVNPLIVGRYLGAEAMGYIALAVRLVETLSFVRGATWRISVAALAKFQNDRDRLARAITEGMRLQLLALGPLLVGFGWVAPWLMPTLFGEKWTAVLWVYPFIAAGSLANAQFTMQASTLAVLGRTGRAAWIAAALVAPFAVAVWVGVQRLGLTGYGWAELAILPVYALYHLALRREVTGIGYGQAVIGWLAFTTGLFTGPLGWCGYVAPWLLLLLPETRRTLADLTAALIRRGSAAGESLPANPQ